jgi:flagellin
MTSIHTNVGAIAALQTLRSVASHMGETQLQVSSGLRVEAAADNAAYWSIATTMRSDNKAISAVRDALGLSAAVLDTTSTAVEASIGIMSEITAKLVAARQDGVDRSKVDKELSQFKQQLQSIMDSASFNGQNWLSWNSGADSLDKQIVSSFARNADGSVSLDTITYAINTPPPRTDTNVQYFVDNGGSGEYGILSTEAFAVEVGSARNYVLIRGATAPISAIEMTLSEDTTAEEIDHMIATVEAMTQQMVAIGSQIGSITARVAMQTRFAEDLMDSLDEGIGRLVDADMNEASTRLKALQTQEQLVTQSLSIANTNAQSVMQLLN